LQTGFPLKLARADNENAGKRHITCGDEHHEAAVAISAADDRAGPRRKPLSATELARSARLPFD
jgi:hypothetical protein